MKHSPYFKCFLNPLREKQLEAFPCLTARFYGYYDTSTEGLYCEGVQYRHLHLSHFHLVGSEITNQQP